MQSSVQAGARIAWGYALRTNKHFTLKQNTLTRADLDEFVACHLPENVARGDQPGRRRSRARRSNAVVYGIRDPPQVSAGSKWRALAWPPRLPVHAPPPRRVSDHAAGYGRLMPAIRAAYRRPQPFPF